jgi:hypothetical protein
MMKAFNLDDVVRPTMEIIIAGRALHIKKVPLGVYVKYEAISGIRDRKPEDVTVEEGNQTLETVIDLVVTIARQNGDTEITRDWLLEHADAYDLWALVQACIQGSLPETSSSGSKKNEAGQTGIE